MNDDDDVIRYDLWIEDALKSVIRRALLHAQTHGLPGEHHFYITFQTGEDGVDIPGYLAAQHPDEMTIVLQHQFDDLEVTDDLFAVTLRFKGKPERLVIPFDAVSGFADPSVNFGLQLKLVPVEGEELDIDGEAEEDELFPGLEPADVTRLEPTSAAEEAEAGGDKAGSKGSPQSGEVIALDSFRKK